MTSGTIREVPGLLVAAGDGWAANVGLIAWDRGPITTAQARRQLKAEGRQLFSRQGRWFVVLLPDEYDRLQLVALHFQRLMGPRLQGAWRG